MTMTSPHASKPSAKRPELDPIDFDAQQAHISLSFEADDPVRVIQAIKDVSRLRRVPCALDDNPRLSEIMRAVRDLGLGFVVSPLELFD